MRRFLFTLMLVPLFASEALAARPAECDEMQPLFTTGEWTKVPGGDFFVCKGSEDYSDGTTLIYTVTSLRGSEEAARLNFAVMMGSADKIRRYADILRVMDRVSFLLKKRTGKNAPEFLQKAALDMREGEYFVDGLHVSISARSHASDLTVTLWK